MQVFVAIATFASPTSASSVILELCSSTDAVVIGTIVEQVPRWHVHEMGRQILQRTEFRVDRVVDGPPLESIAFDVRGGELDGVGASVGGEMRGTVGSRYLLFLNSISESPLPLRIARRALDPSLPLPPEEELRLFWSTACAQHPAGIPPIGLLDGAWPRWSLAAFSGITAERGARSKSAPSLGDALPLEPCQASRRLPVPLDIEEGLCLGGHFDPPNAGWQD